LASAKQLLRIHLQQQWYSFSDLAMEDALIEVPTMRRFAGIELISDRIPDETTILTFRHLLEKHGLGEQIFDRVKALVAARGVTMRQVTIVDAALIATPSSTSTRAKLEYAGGERTKRGTPGSPNRASDAGWRCSHHHGGTCKSAKLLNPFCPLTTAKILALKATILVLLTLLIKARVQIVTGSALGIALLLLQTLVFLAVSGGLVLAALLTVQQRKSAAA
jgi:hypothetical protein